MATKPTRLQQQACDLFAESLVLVAEGMRLDNRSTVDDDRLRDLAARISGASSAFSVDEIVSRALERRGKSLGLRAGIAECLTLFDAEISPLAMLVLDDAAFKELAARLEQELGDV